MVVGYFVLVGALSGILIAVIILNEIRPGHPFYLGVKGFLQSMF